MRVLVIGLGAFGLCFARSMRHKGHETIAIERDEGLADRSAVVVGRAVVGDGTDPSLLARAGAAEVDAAVIATGRDLSTTILAIMALRDLGVREIYARAQSVSAARALDRLGVTEAVFPERDAGSRLAHRVASRAALDYAPIGEGFSLQEIAVPESWIGSSLARLEPREKLSLQIVAVRDALTGALSLPPIRPRSSSTPTPCSSRAATICSRSSARAGAPARDRDDRADQVRPGCSSFASRRLPTGSTTDPMLRRARESRDDRGLRRLAHRAPWRLPTCPGAEPSTVGTHCAWKHAHGPRRARSGAGILCALRGARRALRPAPGARQGTPVMIYLAAGGLAAALLVYLLIALLVPERLR